MQASELVQPEITINADAATVFAFFTEPQRLIRWLGVSADLEPQPGGIMLVEVIPGFVARGESKRSFRFRGWPIPGVGMDARRFHPVRR
jgi:uncharacterized protein YndB with AHSA1/START domain